MDPVLDASVEDRFLVEAFLRERSEAAFRALYRRHTPRLYQLVLRLTGWRDEDACEIVQDSWVRAVRKLPEFRWESRLATWLAGIALNRASERRRAEPPMLPIDAEAGDDAAAEAAPELRLDLERGIAGLPRGCRQVLILHDIEGHTHAEIGALLGIDAGTSKSQLFEARKALRGKLGR